MASFLATILPSYTISNLQEKKNSCIDEVVKSAIGEMRARRAATHLCSIIE